MNMNQDDKEKREEESLRRFKKAAPYYVDMVAKAAGLKPLSKKSLKIPKPKSP